MTAAATVTPKSPAHLYVIDGLRGFAMLLVVAYHFWPGFVQPVALTIVARGSFDVIEIFYFLSGFAIFYPYARSLVDARPEQTMRAFALRRFAKIVPSYFLSLAVIIALGWSNRDPGAPLGIQVLTHVLFIQNLFPGTLNGINGVLWSLGVEVQFYALFALTRRFAMRSPFAYAAVLVAIAIAYRVFVVSTLHGYSELAADQLPAALDFIGAGIACAYLYRRIDAHAPALAARTPLWTALAVVAALACYGQLFLLERSITDRGFPISLAMVLESVNVILIFGLTLGTLFASRAWSRVVANPVFIFVAGISYNVYLWHQVIYLALLRGFATAAHSRLGVTAIALVATVCSGLVATAVTRWFERPIMKRFRRLEDG